LTTKGRIHLSAAHLIKYQNHQTNAAEIARELNASSSGVRRILKNMGLNTSLYRERKTQFNREVVEKYKELKNLRLVAEIFKITASRAHQIVKKLSPELMPGRGHRIHKKRETILPEEYVLKYKNGDMNRREIADATGLTVKTVSRELQLLNIQSGYKWNEDKVIAELLKMGNIPTKQELAKQDKCGLYHAIQKHGGFKYFRKKLNMPNAYVIRGKAKNDLQ
jgi:DNA-binding MarR family transcriptional regulator